MEEFHVTLPATAEYQCIGGKSSAYENFGDEAMGSSFGFVKIPEYRTVSISVNPEKYSLSEEQQSNGDILGIMEMNCEVSDTVKATSKTNAKEKLKNNIGHNLVVELSTAQMTVFVGSKLESNNPDTPNQHPDQQINHTQLTEFC